MPRYNAPNIDIEYWTDGDGLEVVAAWARQGLTNEDIAKRVGISKATFYKWKKEHINFSNALKYNSDIADAAVENALYMKATGYELTETRESINEDGNTTHTQTVKKEYAPDTLAAFFWLKNRQPERWRDKPHPEPDNSNMSKEEFIEAVKGAAGAWSNE